MARTPDQDTKSNTSENGQADASIQTFAPYLLNRIVHRYNQSVQKVMRARGLNIPKMRAIAALASQGDLTVNDLTVYAVSEQSTMSRMLDQMEQDNLVVRKTDSEDNRVRVVSLTDAGHALHSEIWPDMLAAEADMFKGIKAKDKAALLDTLGAVLRNIRINDF
jgi:DNA-binding MarR family transcriptional regulator